MQINICFSENDNLPIEQFGNKSWIENFTYLLTQLIKSIRNTSPKVTMFSSSELSFEESTSGIQFYLFILSDNFLQDPECVRMIELFEHKKKDESTNEKNILIQINKSNMAGRKLPEFLSGSIHYDFYVKTGKKITSEKISYFPKGALIREDFLEYISNLAYDIYNIYQFRSEQEKDINHREIKGIFLAETQKSLEGHRNALKNELINQGYIILPEVPLPDRTSEYYKSLQQYLSECNSSIHLLSSENKVIHFSGNKGKEEIQVDQAVQYLKNQQFLIGSSDFKIVVWFSGKPDILKDDPSLKYIFNIQQIEEVDFIQRSFEDFKSYLLQNMDQRQITDSIAEHLDFYIKGTKPRLLYFIYDKKDSSEAEEYVKHLRVRGFSVLTSIFDTDLISVRKTHVDNLLKFEVAIIFARKASVNWIITQMQEILKSPGFGKENEILGKIVWSVSNELIAEFLDRYGFDFLPLQKEDPTAELNKYLNSILKI